MTDFIWIVNPETGEPERVSYEELDHEVYAQLFKPLGGFCYRVSDYLKLDLPTAPFYIKSWLPKHGRLLIYAPAKSGKSFLCQQIARCIGSGDDFLGQATNAGRVLYLQFELGEEILQDRLRKTGKDYQNVYVGTTFSMKLDHAHGQKQLLDALSKIEPNVVILDPLYKLIAGDENEAHDMSLILDFLDDTLAAYRANELSVVIMHHSGKDISKGGRGSSVLEGWADSYVEMRKVADKDDPTLRIRLVPKLLRHAELPPEPIEAVMRDFEFAPTEPKDTVCERVYAFILNKSEHGEITTGAEMIQAELGSRKAITNALEDLVSKSLITKPARGEYIIPTETPPVEPKDSAETGKIDYGDD